MPNGILKKNMSGNNGTLISIMDLPSIMYTSWYGDPLILKTEIQPCSHPFTLWI